MELYERIKHRREELNMSQDELATKIGYKSRSTITKIESGINDIPQSKINIFAEALNTTPLQLMGWDKFDKTIDTEALKKEVEEAESLEKLLKHYDYNIKYIQYDEDHFKMKITNMKSNESKLLSEYEYQQFHARLKHLIDFEFSSLKK